MAAEFLAEHGYPENLSNLVLECIRYHHGGPAERSIESILLTDADALDLLGVAGTLKIFSMCPRDLLTARAAAQKYRDASVKAITTEKAREFAAKRIQETDDLLCLFEEETFGLY